ncbi:MAG: hypothetical protein AAGH15_26150 [Myxococcota bacterium]
MNTRETRFQGQRWWAAALAIAFAGCAGGGEPREASSARTEASGGEQEEAAAAVRTTESAPAGRDLDEAGTQVVFSGVSDRSWDDLQGQEAALDAALGASSLDCPAADRLAQRVCELADRICAIADDTGDPETLERCDDGRERCARGLRRVADRCS